MDAPTLSSDISAKDVNDVAEGVDIIFVDDASLPIGVAIRDRFPNRGPNANRLGWSIADEERDTEQLIDDFIVAPLDPALRFAYPADAAPLPPMPNEDNFKGDEEYEEAWETWLDELHDILGTQTRGVLLAEGEVLCAVSIGNGRWKSTGCAWRSDEDAAKFFTPPGTRLVTTTVRS